MQRCFVLLFLLFALFWQSVALARVGSTVNALLDLGHTALHWQEEGHHHHDDGSFHLDDSSESLQHVLGDQLNTSLALLPFYVHDFAARGGLAPPSLHDAGQSQLFLEGPLRPPRLHA